MDNTFSPTHMQALLTERLDRLTALRNTVAALDAEAGLAFGYWPYAAELEVAQLADGLLVFCERTAGGLVRHMFVTLDHHTVVSVRDHRDERHALAAVLTALATALGQRMTELRELHMQLQAIEVSASEVSA